VARTSRGRREVEYEWRPSAELFSALMIAMDDNDRYRTNASLQL
jgi:hypothetical protein